MRVISADTDFSTAWNDWLAGYPEASIYHRYEWRKFFADYFNKETIYLAATDDGQCRGVLPLVRLKSRLFGDFLVSLPFVNYGGIVADSEDAKSALIEKAVAVATDLGVSHIELRHQAPMLDLPCRTDKVAMILDLPDTSEEMSRRLGAKRRSQIKRPMRENPNIRFGTHDVLETFYTVFSTNMRDLGTPVYARSMFERLLELFPDNTQVVSIEIDGRPAAGAFLVHDNGRLEIPWASTIRAFNRISINMLLYWEVIRFAIDRGMQQFDFGRSTIDSGTFRFKKQWGAKPLSLHWHYWLANGGSIPQLNPDNARYNTAIKAWQRLPLPIANFLGPRIVRHLP